MDAFPKQNFKSRKLMGLKLSKTFIKELEVVLIEWTFRKKVLQILNTVLASRTSPITLPYLSSFASSPYSLMGEQPKKGGFLNTKRQRPDSFKLVNPLMLVPTYAPSFIKFGE